MRHNPEFTYRRLLDAAAMAKRLGAQIMGLGAFTKVGDAGVTVAQALAAANHHGYSYASGALWAAHDAMLRLQPRPHPRARRPRQVQIDGRGCDRRHWLGVRTTDCQGR